MLINGPAHEILVPIILPSNEGSGLEVIKLEYSLKLKIKHNDWLLVAPCLQAANHCALFLSLKMNSSFITSRPGKSAQTRKSLSCSHMKSMDVDQDSDLIFELYPSWIRQHGRLRGGACVQTFI